jgi:hypothetical protein
MVTFVPRSDWVDEVVDYITAALTSIPGVVGASETVAGVVELASTAEMTTGTDASRVPSVAKVAAYVAAALTTMTAYVDSAVGALSTATTAALGGKADKSGSWNQFSDVADTAYTEGDTPVFSSGALQPLRRVGRRIEARALCVPSILRSHHHHS